MEFFSSVLSIILIDLVLSGDNAVVIGLAAHRLPLQQRKMAILLGGGAAIVLRMGLTAVAALLLQIPILQLVGGLLLLWIAVRLLAAEEESHEGIKAAASLRQAIVTILVADFIMSTDNVLGVAGASHGDVGLLLFGLVLSMAILMFMGSLVANVVNRIWWLAYVGSAVIAWTGVTMIFEDSVVHQHLGWLGDLAEHSIAAAVTIATLLFAHWFHRVRGAVGGPAGESQGA
jgi:YjbE family integral membrane protein